MTVSRAYGQLESEGLLERRRGKGMVVAAVRRSGAIDRIVRLQQLQPLLEELSRQARELGLPPTRCSRDCARFGGRMMNAVQSSRDRLMLSSFR